MGETMEWVAKVGWMGCVAALATACSPSTEMVGHVGDTETGTGGTATGSMTDPSATGAEDGDETGADDGGDDEDPWEEDGSETAGSVDIVECLDDDLPACTWEGTDCVYHYGWNCKQCIGEVSTEICYEFSTECEYPWLECPELPSPCAAVRPLGAGAITAFEDEDAPVCVLESLRDGVAGVYVIEWGEEVTDDTWPYVEVLVGSDGAATMQVDLRELPSVESNGGTLVRSFGLGLQPASYFDDCLESPTPESLAQCILGFTEIDAENPIPVLWTPPFTTGECVNEVFECPPA